MEETAWEQVSEEEWACIELAMAGVETNSATPVPRELPPQIEQTGALPDYLTSGLDIVFVLNLSPLSRQLSLLLRLGRR